MDTSAPLPSTLLVELADECVCPISQSLMVDPVIAGDGHTYDRAQIETWIRQQEADGRVPATSPHTREPFQDTRLVSNMALRRTIERLVNSGRLDVQVVNEWRAGKEAMSLSTINAKRDMSLAHAPIGTRIALKVMLVPRQDANADVMIANGSTPLRDLMVDLHAATEGRGGGFFGGSRASAGRLLVAGLSLGDAMMYIEAASESDGTGHEMESTIKAALDEPLALPSGPVPADVLIASVFPAPADESCRACLALEHVVRRLASIENGLPASVQAEWCILDQELQRQRRIAKLKKLKDLLTSSVLKAAGVVHSVDDTGAFSLSFVGFGEPQSPEEDDHSASVAPCPMAQVPSDFIGKDGLVADSSNRHRSGRGAFGATTGGARYGARQPETGNDGGASEGGPPAFGAFGANMGGARFGARQPETGSDGGASEGGPPAFGAFGANMGGARFGARQQETGSDGGASEAGPPAFGFGASSRDRSHELAADGPGLFGGNANPFGFGGNSFAGGSATDNTSVAPFSSAPAPLANASQGHFRTSAVGLFGQAPSSRASPPAAMPGGGLFGRAPASPRGRRGIGDSQFENAARLFGASTDASVDFSDGSDSQ